MSGSRIARYALGAILLLGSLGAMDSFAAGQTMMDTGGVATLGTLQPDTGAASASANTDLTLSAVKKIDGKGMPGEKVDWTVTGPGQATLTPASSTTSAQTATDEAGIASTVFRASAPGSYDVTATTQKNPGCSTPSCATYISIRYALTVTAAGAATTDEHTNGHGALVGTAVAVGAGLALLANNRGDDNQSSILRTLTAAGGDGQSARPNAPLAKPLVVHATNDGSNASSVAIQWTATGGAVLSSPSNSTDARGFAEIQVVSVGPGPGPVTVTATRGDASGVSVSFTVNVLQPSLTIVSGDGQAGSPNRPVANPLVVEADVGGAPQKNVPISWTVTAGDATITGVSNGGNTSASGQSQASVRFGATAGPVEITATRTDTGQSQVFHLDSTIVQTLTIRSGDDQSGFTNRRATDPLVVEADGNGVPQAGVAITWTVTAGDATVTNVSNGGNTNGSGQSSAIITFGSTPGAVDITATRNDSGASQTFHLSSVQTNALTIVRGDGQTGLPNRPLPQGLVVQAETNNHPAAGVTIFWNASNGATLSASTTVTGAGGQTSVRVTDMGSSFGPVTVTATRADDPTASVQFTESITPPTMNKVSGDAQSGLIGSAATAPLVVQVIDGAGVPAAGQTVTWTVSSGSAVLSSSTSTTGSNGRTHITFDYGSSTAPIVITASAYSGNLSVDFTATATTASSLIKVTGDNQSGAAGTPLPIQLRVRIQPPPGTTILSGVPITFAVTSGSASVTASQAITDVNGEAFTKVNLGLTPGPVTVLAQVSGGGASATFNETVAGTLVPGALTIVSGDGQVIEPNTASQPMVVELKGGTTPLAGQTINWSTTTGTLTVGSSVTDANGRASATITPTTTGPIQVTASFPGFAQYVAAQVTFSQNTTLSTLPTLSTNDQSVGAALDSACASLEAIPNRTQQQQDLLNQCLALNSASTVSTAAAATAIHQLLPNVTETQTKTASTATTAQFDNIAQRMSALRSGAHGASFGGLAFTNDSGALSLFDVGSALLGAADKPAEETTSFSRWGVFASGQIGRQDASAQGPTPGYDLDIHGLTFGVDYRENDHLVLGGALGYTRQTTNLDGGQGDLSMHGWSLSGYATWYRKNNWYLDSSLTWSSNNYDSRRHIGFALPLPDGSTVTVDQLALASSGGNALSGSLTFGRDFNNKALSYGFYGKAQYSHQSFDAFQEQLNASLPGSGLGLRVDSRTESSVASVLGGKIDYTHSTSWGVVIPHAEAEWQHEFHSDPNAFRAFFVNDPTGTPILVQGDALDSNFFRLGAGLSFVFKQGRSGFILYDRTLGRSGITQDNLSIGFRMEF